MSANPRQHIRRRASSVSQALSAIPLNNAPHNEKVPLNAASSPNAASTFETGASVLINPSLQLNGSVDSFAAAQEIADKAVESQLRQRRATSEDPKTTGNTTPAFRKQQHKSEDGRRYESDGLWRDVRSGKWMLIPSSSFKLLALPVLFYLNHRYILTNPALPMPSVVRQLLPLDSPNFWKPLILLSGLDRSDSSSGYLYKRDVRDLAFIAYYIVVFSFIRQFITLQILRPLASRLGVARGKTDRFTEQGYAFVYFGFFGILGILVMRGLPTWWYSTSAFWTTFPVLRMPGTLKAYYLLQASYWCQQTIILAAGVEKPRKDFKELIAHHLVTLWLIGWSYLLTLTYIGVAIFVTMDVSDIFLALAKCVNYVNEDASAPVFAFFVVVWTYMRHYLNIKILYSVWTEFELIPKWARVSFRPWKETELMAGWMKYQIFAPILLLQGLNLFWWFLIMRILFRAIFSKNLADERSDGEEEEEELDVHAGLNGALKVD